ncbi:15053_t:CDS:2 [Cetraspora pellucida]|uniref:15053_t:CDS:1 n=1 Tax=Cetraspora pellucida TaxID=1433469 RepID=A0ACA9JVV8_9GLOM|nr:15053_t:CDS:2 [Cetraspora pellucida]
MPVPGFWVGFSKAIGWTYFLAWSISFYPQAILNWRRKSVQGLSLDFLWYNIYGFTCYSAFNIAFFTSEEVRKEYRDRNNGKDNLVQPNDVFFAVHAFVLSFITLSQTFYYRRSVDQKVSPVARILIIGSVIGIVLMLIGVEIGTCQWIDLLYYLSYIKLTLSFIKYLPQSTVGWSIHNILLDFTGGILSICQLFLDAYLTNNWSGISGDSVKLRLQNVKKSQKSIERKTLYLNNNKRRNRIVSKDLSVKELEKNVQN